MGKMKFSSSLCNAVMHVSDSMNDSNRRQPVEVGKHVLPELFDVSGVHLGPTQYVSQCPETIMKAHPSVRVRRSLDKAIRAKMNHKTHESFVDHT